MSTGKLNQVTYLLCRWLGSSEETSPLSEIVLPVNMNFVYNLLKACKLDSESLSALDLFQVEKSLVQIVLQFCHPIMGCQSRLLQVIGLIHFILTQGRPINLHQSKELE
jgi:hypothetical protein